MLMWSILCVLVDIVNPFSSFDVPFSLVNVVVEPAVDSDFECQVWLSIEMLTWIFLIILLNVGPVDVGSTS